MFEETVDNALRNGVGTITLTTVHSLIFKNAYFSESVPEEI